MRAAPIPRYSPCTMAPNWSLYWWNTALKQKAKQLHKKARINTRNNFWTHDRIMLTNGWSWQMTGRTFMPTSDFQDFVSVQGLMSFRVLHLAVWKSCPSYAAQDRQQSQQEAWRKLAPDWWALLGLAVFRSCDHPNGHSIPQLSSGAVMSNLSDPLHLQFGPRHFGFPSDIGQGGAPYEESSSLWREPPCEAKSICQKKLRRKDPKDSISPFVAMTYRTHGICNHLENAHEPPKTCTTNYCDWLCVTSGLLGTCLQSMVANCYWPSVGVIFSN